MCLEREPRKCLFARPLPMSHLVPRSLVPAAFCPRLVRTFTCPSHLLPSVIAFTACRHCAVPVFSRLASAFCPCLVGVAAESARLLQGGRESVIIKKKSRARPRALSVLCQRKSSTKCCPRSQGRTSSPCICRDTRGILRNSPGLPCLAAGATSPRSRERTTSTRPKAC